MPVPKSRTQQVRLVDEIADFLGIDSSVVFLDAVAPIAAAGKGKNTRKRKNTLRIWTGNMDGDEKRRIIALKDEVKAMAGAVDTKIALSDRHPLGDDGQIAFEERRRASRGKKWAERKGHKP